MLHPEGVRQAFPPHPSGCKIGDWGKPKAVSWAALHCTVGAI